MKHVSVRGPFKFVIMSKVADTIGTSCDAANSDYDDGGRGRELVNSVCCCLRQLPNRQRVHASFVAKMSIEARRGKGGQILFAK